MLITRMAEFLVAELNNLTFLSSGTNFTESPHPTESGLNNRRGASNNAPVAGGGDSGSRAGGSGKAFSDLDAEDVIYIDSETGQPVTSSRPASQRSQETLRQVSSLLFIATPATVKRVDKTRLNELDSATLVDLIKDYMSDNQDLRKENQDLFSVRDMLLRDQELVCRENERLLKKLEDVTS